MDNKTYLINTLETVHQRNLENLKVIRRIITSTFGEENIQLIKADHSHLELLQLPFSDFKSTVSNFLNGSYYTIVLRFPEILLTSEDTRTHTIKDLFVRFSFNQHLKMVGDYEGLRTSFTRAEWNSDYGHSHLSGRSTEWGRFCTGSGPINQSIALLRTGFNDVDFQMFCLHIKSYVAWESISGTPYRYIRDINEASTSLPSNWVIHQTTAIEELAKRFVAALEAPDLKLLFKPQITQGLVQSVISDELEKALGSFIKRLKDSNAPFLSGLLLENIVGFKTEDGRYLKIQNTSDVMNYRRRLAITFRKQEFYTEIIDGSNSVDGTQFYAHPEITKYVIKRLSTKLTRAAIEISTGEPESDSTNFGTTSE